MDIKKVINIIDVHCHLEYMANPSAVAEEAKQRGMTAIITSVPDPKDMDAMLKLQEKYKGFVFLSLGFHPHEVSGYSDAQLDEYIEKIRKHRNSIVAVGEAGLDYNEQNLDEKKKEMQKSRFRRFVKLAEELHLPLVVHTRNSSDGSKNAYNDVFSVLEKHQLRVVLHCFSGSETDLKTALDRGYWISFATNVCKTKKHPRLAEKTPLDRMLLETDAPWLDPDSQPNDALRASSGHGSKELTNKPWKIARSAAVIAELHSTTKEYVLDVTTKNAKKVFGI